MDQQGDNNPQQFPDQNYQLQSDDQIGGNYQLWEYDERIMNQQGQVEEWQPQQNHGDGYQHYHDAHQVPNMPYDNSAQSYYQDFTKQTNDFAGLFPAGTEQSSNSQSNAQIFLETPENQGVGSLHVQQSQFHPAYSQFANPQPQPAQYDAPAQQPYQIFQNVTEMDVNHVSNVVPEERVQNKVALQDPSQESEFQQILEPGMTDAEKNPLPGPSSEGSKGRNLKRKNDRAKKETKGANPKEKSTSTKTDSDKIKYAGSMSGNCGECPERDYHGDIYYHFKIDHNGLQRKKCTVIGCKIHFGSEQKRIDHERNDPHLLKKFRCGQCSHSTDYKDNLNLHVLRIHSEKTVKCEDLNCSRMFGLEADMKKHVNDYHKREKCPTCGKEMTVAVLRQHNFHGRCHGAAE